MSSTAAVSAPFASALNRRRTPSWIHTIAVLAVIAEPVRVGVDVAGRAAFYDHDDVYSSMMNGPTVLVFPLVAVLLSCLPLHEQLRARHVANTRTRMPSRLLAGRHLRRVAIVAGGVFFLHAFVAFLVAHVVWPWFGDPAIDWAPTDMTPAEVVENRLTGTSYTFLYAHGTFVYGLAYAGWVGLAAAAYATLGACILFLLPNRILALSIPFLVYATGTAASALIGAPRTGLMSSVFPYGLVAGHPLEAAASTLIVILGTAALAVLVIVRAPTNPRLS